MELEGRFTILSESPVKGTVRAIRPVDIDVVSQVGSRRVSVVYERLVERVVHGVVNDTATVQDILVRVRIFSVTKVSHSTELKRVSKVWFTNRVRVAQLSQTIHIRSFAERWHGRHVYIFDRVDAQAINAVVRHKLADPCRVSIDNV